mmetsp:Transcript_68807/g.108485  ORF Transcript_68807/g.108485 Transcript_68807/m.108485 type:complete len:220 (-) Transcript_68807:522-1181(-)
MSPRNPSMLSSEHTWEIFLAISGSVFTSFNLFCASKICVANSWLSSRNFSLNPTGSSAKSRVLSTIFTRSSGSRSVLMSACMPKRSNSWGRSSPSSGLPLPTRMNLAGWRMLMPSRSTVFQPPAAESSRTSTRWSSSKFTSSTYKIPRFAFASSPGSKAFLPWVRAFSMSMVPQTRSSVAPKGRSIMGTFLYFKGKSSPVALRSRTSWLMTSSSSGEEL